MTGRERIERERLERVRLQGEGYTNEELIQFLAAGMIRQCRLEEDLTARDKEIRELKQFEVKVTYRYPQDDDLSIHICNGMVELTELIKDLFNGDYRIISIEECK